MQFKGTKGKWVCMISGFKDYIQVFIEGKDVNIRSVFHKIFNPESIHFNEDYYNENKANALLISKAPEMLEALQTTLEELRDINGLNNHCDYIERLIKEATEL